MRGCIFLTVCLALSCSAFRVTKDHGYGIMTFENSKTGERGLSVAGGNSWVRSRSIGTSANDYVFGDDEIDYAHVEKSKAGFLVGIDTYMELNMDQNGNAKRLNVILRRRR